MNSSLRNTRQNENFMKNNFSYFQLFDNCNIHRVITHKKKKIREFPIRLRVKDWTTYSVPYFTACILGGCGNTQCHSLENKRDTGLFWSYFEYLNVPISFKCIRIFRTMEMNFKKYFEVYVAIFSYGNIAISVRAEVSNSSPKVLV